MRQYCHLRILAFIPVGFHPGIPQLRRGGGYASDDEAPVSAGRGVTRTWSHGSIHDSHVTTRGNAQDLKAQPGRRQRASSNGFPAK